MRAISFILWSYVIDENGPIPFLGLEAAMRMTDSEPDQILDNAIRMTRIDTYRLSMVMLSYASCARALQLRLAVDKGAVRLPERLKSMRGKLKVAMEQFAVIKRIRGEGLLDPKSSEVIDEAIKRIRGVIEGLPQL